MINPHDDIPGKLLVAPFGRARIRVRPIRSRAIDKTKALRVQVFTEGGVPIFDRRVAELELTRIEIPRTRPDGHHWLEKRPGAMWFYGDDGSELGFMADQNGGALLEPGAVELARRGPTMARDAAQRPAGGFPSGRVSDARGGHPGPDGSWSDVAGDNPTHGELDLGRKD